MRLGYKPQHFKSPASCTTALSDGASFDLIVSDLMMPSYGRYSKEQTQNGLLTGVLFVADLRELLAETPIILLTNLNVSPLFGNVKQSLADVVNVFVARKSDDPPEVLAETIRCLLEEGIPLDKRRGLLCRFWDNLVIEPTFFGVGIRIKKLLFEAK